MFGLGLPELLIFLMFALPILPIIFFLVTLSKTLSLTQEYHTVDPGLVWLLLIPFFYLGWQFYILSNATKGINGKFQEIGKNSKDGGYGIGLAYCILNCLAWIPFIGLIFYIPALITWIIYWVKISSFNKEMAQK